MNKSYRVVFNESTNTWAAVPENTKARGKRSSKKSVAIAAALLATVSAPSFATTSAGTSPLIVNDMDFGVNDGGVCTVVTGDGSISGGTGNVNCNSNALSKGYNNALQTASVVVASNDMSVGGYQYINGYDANGNALTVNAAGANIALNNGQITGVAAGTNATDAVNMSQLTKLYNTGTKYFHANSTGADSSASGANAIAVGQSAVSSNTNAVAMGLSSTAAGSGSMALGSFSTATNTNALAIGTQATANNANDVALGAGSVTSAVVNTTGVTLGTTTYTFAGTNATSTVSVGGNGVVRTITNVAAGQITASSTDGRCRDVRLVVAQLGDAGRCG
jgi:autotransporter adhesin